MDSSHFSNLHRLTIYGSAIDDESEIFSTTNVSLGKSTSIHGKKLTESNNLSFFPCVFYEFVEPQIP